MGGEERNRILCSLLAGVRVVARETQRQKTQSNQRTLGKQCGEELESNDSILAQGETFSGRMERVKQTGRRKVWKKGHVGKERGWRKSTLVLVAELPRLKMETFSVYVTVLSPLKGKTEDR